MHAMPHPDIDNDTPLVLEPLVLLHEDGHPAVTVVVKASFAIEAHGLVLLERQPGIVHDGELWWPDAPVSSYRFEPELAPVKLATDVAIVGHVHAPRVGTRALEIGARVGPLSKRAWVFGERRWRSGPRSQLDGPAPFERVPLCYERAFGGVDSSDPSSPDIDARNPLGRGHRRTGSRPLNGELAPNIEDPAAPIGTPHDRPAPVGFGFTSPNWVPRAARAGTFDESWARWRRPLLPRDFDLRHYSAASSGLRADGYLRGDETVELLHIGPAERLTFRLPGLPPPTLRIHVARGSDATPPLRLDTVIVDTDRSLVSLLWRARICLEGGAHDLRAIELRSPISRTLPRLCPAHLADDRILPANTPPEASPS